MGVAFITTFHYFISLETANTQKSEVFLLGILSGNENASVVVTCHQVTSFPGFFRKNTNEKVVNLI